MCTKKVVLDSLTKSRNAKLSMFSSRFLCSESKIGELVHLGWHNQGKNERETACDSFGKDTDFLAGEKITNLSLPFVKLSMAWKMLRLEHNPVTKWLEEIHHGQC